MGKERFEKFYTYISRGLSCLRLETMKNSELQLSSFLLVFISSALDAFRSSVDRRFELG